MGAGNEIQLTDGIASLMRERAVYAHRYDGTRYDCGSKACSRPPWRWDASTTG